VRGIAVQSGLWRALGPGTTRVPPSFQHELILKSVLADRKAVDCGVEHHAGLPNGDSVRQGKVPTEIPEEPESE
jgi:hypothetical protein